MQPPPTTRAAQLHISRPTCTPGLFVRGAALTHIITQLQPSCQENFQFVTFLLLFGVSRSAPIILCQSVLSGSEKWPARTPASDGGWKSSRRFSGRCATSGQPLPVGSSIKHSAYITTSVLVPFRASAACSNSLSSSVDTRMDKLCLGYWKAVKKITPYVE